nr:retrotransposon protein, putative, unclassified [Tanacetum cinerariifolium]
MLVEMIAKKKRFFTAKEQQSKETVERRMIAVARKQEEKAGSKLKPKSPKKLKVIKEQESTVNEQEKEELRLCLKIFQDEDKAINYETLAVKSLIVDWESQLLKSDLQEEDLSYWKITRSDGSSRFYKVFSTTLEEFDRQDLLDLHRLVMKRFESIAPEGYDLILWGDLKTMIEPNKEDKVWKNQPEWSVISWKLYEYCGVHTFLMDGQDGKKTVPSPQYVLLPLLTSDCQGPKSSEDEVADDAGKKSTKVPRKENRLHDPAKEGDKNDQEKDDANGKSTYRMFNPVSAVGSSYVNLGGSIPVNAATLLNADLPTDPLMPDLEDNIEAIQDELLQFRLKKVWRLVDLPKGKHAIGPKWVYENKKDEREIIVRNKARLVAQGHTLEEGIDYDEVFAPVARIEAIRLFLAYASFMGFIVYQMDVKSVFLYDTIEEKVHLDDIVFGSTKKSLCTEFEALKHKKFQMSFMGELTFFLGFWVMQRDDGIFISQDKYVADILKKFDFSSVKIASTPIKTNKSLLKDEEAKYVDVHLYRSMIGSLMYLIASRPDVMFAVCACARFQVTPKVSHLHIVKRIVRYLKGQPKLGLWYPRDSPFDLESFTNSDYAGASLDRKSTTRGCQFLGKRLIS